jgi:uncharacterized protein YbjT (DUF2867 family)
MRVLVLGGTGSIGGPVVRELVRGGHEVVALARSAASADSVARLGARPIAGDMATPERWLAALPPLDGVIHAAAAFGARRSDPEIISEDQIAAELGEWARGYALHQWQSGEKARRRLGWRPLHLDPESAIHAIP